MDPVYRRNFDEPDEVVELEKTRSELLTIGGLTMAHDTHQPGWHWAEHVRPHVGTDSCQAHHMSFIIRGRLRVRLDDGTEFECRNADGGQVLVSDLTKTFARGTHLEFEEVGEVELRGLDEPIRLHQVRAG